VPTKKGRSLLNRNATIDLLYHLIRGYSGTYRLSVENEKVWMERVEAGKPVVICCWHQQFFSAIRHFKTYSTYNPPLMISRSRDGELIAGIATRTGWDIVRGSSSKGGRSALETMTEKLKEKKIAAHIVDGPRGPAGVVKAGVIRLAQLGDAVIVPFYTSADRAWYFRSWDRFMIPKPFARVRIRFGNVFPVPQTDTAEAFEQLRRDLETVMLKGLIHP
jgi:lysophospholipid acyltransferase (LPLAT)-like uncharacterized protein